MNRKITYITFMITGILLQACGKGQSVQYGEVPLIIDHSVFDLNIDTFFQDESIFRGGRDFWVSSKEHRLENDTLMTGFIQYWTRAYSKDRVLAQYAETDFERLGLITDWDDKKVLMAYAGTEYASAAGVDRMIARLDQEFGSRATMTRVESFRDVIILNLDYRKDGKFARLGIELPDVDFIDLENPDSYEVKKEVLLTPEIQQALTNKLKETGEISCHLFISQDIMDAVINDLKSRSGFLAHYD